MAQYESAVKGFFLKSFIKLGETFAEMLGVSGLTKSGIGGSEVVGEMELAEGVTFQLQPTPSAKRTEAYFSKPVVDLKGLEEKLGIGEGGEAFGDVIPFLKLPYGPFHRIGGFGNVFAGHHQTELGVILLYHVEYPVDGLGRLFL